MNGLATRYAEVSAGAEDRLTPAERSVVRKELAELAALDLQDTAVSSLEVMRAVAAAVPERLYGDSGDVLRRMHEIAGFGNHQSCLSSLPTVRACFELGLVAGTGGTPPPADLIVGRGHIAPSFYAERYVRGELPFLPLTTLHRGGMTGVVHRDWGFENTMRYSLGVGLAQAVSRAQELAGRGDDRKVVCLAGDGELHEGVTFECIRYAHDTGLDNLVLVVDANDRGIEPLLKPLNRDYLRAYFPTVAEVDGTDAASVRKALAGLLEAPGRAVLVCRTRKGEHSFKLPAAPPRAPSFAATTGRMLADVPTASGRPPVVFTADMANRFGLRGHVPYHNTGLAETLSVGLTLALPEDDLKVVATDAMYYMDSLSMLTEAATGVRNLMVLAGRNWAAWGGSPNAFNLLSLLTETRVYEPVTEAEFHACARRLAAEPGTVHVLSMVDARFTPPAADCAQAVDDGVWINEPGTDDADTAVVTFGYATTLVEEANARLRLPHLHCAALNPLFSRPVLERLRRFRRVVSVEYNGSHGGFGSWLRSRYLLPVTVHGVEKDIDNCVHDEQLRRHGMSPAQLAALLRSVRTEAGESRAAARS
ncbi:1-deoxy-D-xylulose-5-phosphate synthase N-terminal domain-containing protein [Streptomyces sp. NPDC058947]|uniref:1-deoxy-D-xylulose-5-phosphate synthase N-terminal domain-containing protein n=1 Tax=Streptomyces TaxID=1883 RepID=UPI0036BD52CF